MNRKSSHDVYTEYYLNQAGSGFSNIYSGPVYQKGYGIGSFLGGLFRSIYPLLKKGSSVVGSELLKSGANIISDITKNEPTDVVIKKRGKETINNLSKMVGDHFFGSGYTTHQNLKRQQSKIVVRGGKRSKKILQRKVIRKKNQLRKLRRENRKQKVKSENILLQRKEIKPTFSIFLHNGIH